jgi:hypothetical protein
MHPVFSCRYINLLIFKTMLAVSCLVPNDVTLIQTSTVPYQTHKDGVYVLCMRLLYEPGSSVSIVSDYRLDDRAIRVRSPAEAKDISCNLCVQTGSGAHPASWTMVPGVLSPGLKRGRGVTLTTHPIICC